MLKNLERWHKVVAQVAMIFNSAIIRHTVSRSSLEWSIERLEKLIEELRIALRKNQHD